MSGRAEEVKLKNGEILYFYKNEGDDLCLDEVNNLIKKLESEHEINDLSDFNSAREQIFEDNNFEYDEYEDYDFETDEEFE